jgi:hypothetical protein
MSGLINPENKSINLIHHPTARTILSHSCSVIPPDKKDTFPCFSLLNRDITIYRLFQMMIKRLDVCRHSLRQMLKKFRLESN